MKTVAHSGGPSVGRSVARGPYAPSRMMRAKAGKLPRATPSNTCSAARPSIPTRITRLTGSTRSVESGTGAGRLVGRGSRARGTTTADAAAITASGAEDTPPAKREEEHISPDCEQHQGGDREAHAGPRHGVNGLHRQRVTVGEEVGGEQHRG